VRFTIEASSDAEPCLDELEVFTAGPDSRNVALASAGTRATASGTLPGFAIHKLEHLIDGRYGNDHSWISTERGRGWVRLEFPRTEKIDRVVWSRDRSDSPRPFEDRLATAYRIEVSRDGRQWQRMADSSDRLPPSFRRGVPASPPASVAVADWPRVRRLLLRRAEIESRLREATAPRQVYAGRFEQPRPTHRLNRGDPMQPREEVRPGAPAAFGYRLESGPGTPEHERRLALARWVTDPGHPLTARVMVNRLWQYHFGEGIVATPSDFGTNGAPPTHPELLDWLAAEIVAGGGASRRCTG
jgi:hypothetical protein